MKRIEGGGDDLNGNIFDDRKAPGMRTFQFRAGSMGPLSLLIGCPLMILFSAFFLLFGVVAGVVAMLGGRKSRGIIDSAGMDAFGANSRTPNIFVDHIHPNEDIIDIEVDKSE